MNIVVIDVVPGPNAIIPCGTKTAILVVAITGEARRVRGCKVFLEIDSTDGYTCNEVADVDQHGMAMFLISAQNMENVDAVTVEVWPADDLQITVPADVSCIAFDGAPVTLLCNLPPLCVDVTAYRVQGGGGFQSLGFLIHANGRTQVNPGWMPYSQLNISVGDALHARYFCQVKRGGLGDVYIFDIDGDFFHRWIVAAACPSHHFLDYGPWTPPLETESTATAVILRRINRLRVEGRFLDEEQYEAWETSNRKRILAEAKLTGSKDNKAIKRALLKALTAEGLFHLDVLGAWAKSYSPNKEICVLGPIIRTKTCDTEQPSYKLEMVAPWPFLLDLFIKNGRPVVSGSDIQGVMYDPPEIQNLQLFDAQIKELKVRAELAIPKTPKKIKQTKSRRDKKSKNNNNNQDQDDDGGPALDHNRVQQLRGYKRQIEKIETSFNQQDFEFNNRFDDGIYEMYNQIMRLRRELRESQLWWPNAPQSPKLSNNNSNNNNSDVKKTTQ